ncbi:MAG: triple tyrosine motif-containing protein [Bacteroidota bacterium]|nr:triple tyrosine motif-containing protein [Bacteroidota bacterium]
MDSNSNGLSRMTNGRCFNITHTLDSIPLHTNNLILSTDGNLWFGYQDGIGKINPRTLSIKTYGYNEGFTPIQVYPNSVSEDKEGNLWWGTKHGAVKYNKNEDVDIKNEADLYIENIKLGQKNVLDWKNLCDSINNETGLPTVLKLPFTKNEITFEFIGITYHNSEKIKYQYKLEGNDQEWQPLTYLAQANYTNLMPGSYIFKFKAITSDGITNVNPFTFSFIILPPWWDTWWFYTVEICVLFILFGISIFEGRNKENSKLSSILFFLTILIVVEFIAMYIENFADEFSSGVTFVKLIVNVTLAISFAPLEKLSYKFFNRLKRG